MDLQEFFGRHPRAALAFSGGVDSAYLLWAALQNGASVRAHYVKSAFQPAFELSDAQRLAGVLGAELTVLEEDILADPAIRANPADRCYFCKRRIFERICRAAAGSWWSF